MHKDCGMTHRARLEALAARRMSECAPTLNSAQDLERAIASARE
jgi:hypothetical protein